MRTYIHFILFVIIWSCSKTSYKQMSIHNPARLIAIEDSLINTNLTPSIISALIKAHNKLGLAAVDTHNFKKGITHFRKAIALSENDTLSIYHLNMAEGHLLKKTGNKEKIWNAIQKYYEAATMKPELGEPYYHIGESYHKLGDKEFDLIINSYDMALNLNLEDSLRKKIVSIRDDVIKREKRLKNFWR